MQNKWRNLNQTSPALSNYFETRMSYCSGSRSNAGIDFAVKFLWASLRANTS